MNSRIIETLVRKDLLLYFRDKFYGFITIFCIFLFLGIYFLLPKAVDETIAIGIYDPHRQLSIIRNSEEGWIFQQADREETLKQSVLDETSQIGISIPRILKGSGKPGQKIQVKVFLPASLPGEIKDLYTSLVAELMNELKGEALPITHTEEIMGPDMGGRQIPLRKRLIPLLALMLIVTSTLGLANFITLELERGTYQALSVSPMKTDELFTGKGLTGLILTLPQALLIMVVTGSLDQNLLLICTTILLGSVMSVGLAFIISSISRDMMAVVAWGTLLIIAFLIPAFSIMFPGEISFWIKIIPSYFMVDILNKAVNFDVGWNGNLNSLVFLSAFTLIFVFLGLVSLQRKVKCK